MYIYIYIYIYTHICIYTCTCIIIHMYMYICIHLHEEGVRAVGLALHDEACDDDGGVRRHALRGSFD